MSFQRRVAPSVAKMQVWLVTLIGSSPGWSQGAARRESDSQVPFLQLAEEGTGIFRIQG